MKKLVIALTVVLSVAGSAITIANASGNTSSDSEHKPCHATKSNGGRCDCRDCRGNNWGNTYCLNCGHSTKQHY